MTLESLTFFVSSFLFLSPSYLVYRSAICLPQSHSETAITTPANNIENPLEKVTGR